MQSLTVLAVLLVAVCAVNFAMADSAKSAEAEWTEWKATHNRQYATPEEEKMRFEIFKDNKKRIDEHNEKFNRGETTYTMGLNHFSDLTAEEFKNRHTGLRVPLTRADGSQ